MYKSLVAVALSIALFLMGGCGNTSYTDKADAGTSGNLVIAYLSGGAGKPLPDFDKVTNIDYAFGRIDSTFAALSIENPARFKQVADLKNEYNRTHSRQVKMQLSIGGWGSGRFSEMVADPALRHAFVADCKRVVEEYGIDGVDLDWEYPTSGVAGISFSENDIENFTVWVKELRKALGKDKLLTIATISTARFVDFKEVDPYIDFYNIMSYDMAVAPFHHSPLKRFRGSLLIDSLASRLRLGFAGMDYPSDSVMAQKYGHMYKTVPYLNQDFFRDFVAANSANPAADTLTSPIAGQCTTEEAVLMHLAAGLNPRKLTVGMPFYGKTGGDAKYPCQGQFEQTGEPGEGYTEVWDDIAQVPYIADSDGKLIFGFENERSIRSKCRFIKEHGLLGAMYWEYCIDARRPEKIRNKLIDAVADEMLKQ